MKDIKIINERIRRVKKMGRFDKVLLCIYGFLIFLLVVLYSKKIIVMNDYTFIWFIVLIMVPSINGMLGTKDGGRSHKERLDYLNKIKDSLRNGYKKKLRSAKRDSID
jgi:uncharacterized protein YacL